MKILHNYLFVFCFLTFSYATLAQSYSVHQEQLEYYNSLGNADANYYEQNTTAAKPSRNSNKGLCALNKVVYGWHPYWVGNTYLNYDWDLLSHFSFFSYEVDAATGNPISTHGWATSAAVDAALASGNTKVTLTVTLFSGHATFFSSPTAQQTLITNLINLIQSRGAHGVNIDIEGLPAANKTAFTNFMINLANQMHTAIPNSDVSTVLYAVDWNNVFDFTNMASVVDHFIVMGYDYYWSGSTTAGPNDPLYHYSTTYNFNLSKTITYYLNKGCPKNKLILGLPYYGREWSTASATVPSSATASGVARFYNTIKLNTSGNYSATNYQYDADSFSDIYVFNNGTQKQCFISLENSIRKRMEHINTAGIGGMGIWALGYDDGFPELWDAIDDNMTTCYKNACSGTIHDFGGPTKNYYDNENYTWTIAPPNASALSVNFTLFDVEAGFDFLYIYDGPTTASPQIAGSPFSGTTLPPNFTSSTGALAFRFTSDNATVKQGFLATYQCLLDTIKPTTAISPSPTPFATTNFTTNFTDADNVGGSGVMHQFYSVSDFNGAAWRANDTNGFFNDNFVALHQDWTVASGNWAVTNGMLQQTDQSNANTNIYATHNQNNASTYLYHYKASISGTGTNKRAGFHFMSDNGTLPNRGNSYFIWFRQDNAKLQFYKVTNDVFTLVKDVAYSFNANQLYDYKIVYNKTNGTTEIYVDDKFIDSWTDATPLTSGDFVSFRSGDCFYDVDDFQVYKNRTVTEIITVGAAPTNDIRFENPAPTTPSGQIASIVIDTAHNVSLRIIEMVDVDFQIVSINEFETMPIEVYPNPTKNQLTISGLSLENNTEIYIMDMNGKTVYKAAATQTTQQINVAHFANGIYFLQISAAKGNKTIKFVKE